MKVQSGRSITSLHVRNWEGTKWTINNSASSECDRVGHKVKNTFIKSLKERSHLFCASECPNYYTIFNLQ